MMGFAGGLKRIAVRLAGPSLAVVPAILCGGPVAAQSVAANSGPDTTLQLGIVVLAVALVAALACGTCLPSPFTDAPRIVRFAA